MPNSIYEYNSLASAFAGAFFTAYNTEFAAYLNVFDAHHLYSIESEVELYVCALPFYRHAADLLKRAYTAYRLDLSEIYAPPDNAVLHLSAVIGISCY